MPTEIRTAHELLEIEFPPEDHIVSPAIIVRQSLNVLGGGPKLGKSMLSTNLAIQCALGEPWIGFHTTKSRVLVIQAEVPERYLQERLRRMLPEGLGACDLHFISQPKWHVDQTKGARELDSAIKDLRPDLVILDPIASFMAGDENKGQDMMRFLHPFQQIIGLYGCSVLLVHHVGKPSDTPRTGADLLRGSSTLFGAVDTAMMFSRRRGNRLTMTWDLRHGLGLEPTPLRFDDTTLWIELFGPDERYGVIKELIHQGVTSWSKIKDGIIAARGVSERSAKRLINEAVADGYIRRDDKVYTMCHSGGEDE